MTELNNAAAGLYVDVHTAGGLPVYTDEEDLDTYLLDYRSAYLRWNAADNSFSISWKEGYSGWPSSCVYVGAVPASLKELNKLIDTLRDP